MKSKELIGFMRDMDIKIGRIHMEIDHLKELNRYLDHIMIYCPCSCAQYSKKIIKKKPNKRTYTKKAMKV